MPRLFLQGLIEYLPKLKAELANNLLVFVEKAMLLQQVKADTSVSHEAARTWVQDWKGRYKKYLKKGYYKKITLEHFGEYIQWTQSFPHEFFDIFKEVAAHTAGTENDIFNRVFDNEIEEESTNVNVELSPSTFDGDANISRLGFHGRDTLNFTWTGTETELFLCYNDETPEQRLRRERNMKKSLYERVFGESEDENEGESNTSTLEPRPPSSEGEPKTTTSIAHKPRTEISEEKKIEMRWWYEVDTPVMENKLWKEKEKKNNDNTLKSKTSSSNEVCGSLDRLDSLEAESRTTEAEPGTNTSEIEAGTPTSDIKATTEIKPTTLRRSD